MISSFDDHPHPATIQIPTGEASGAKREVPSTVIGMDGQRLALESSQRIGLGTPVSVEYNDAMFLGEVTLCRPHSDEGNFHVEIYVEQMLTGLQSLMKLRAGLMGDMAAEQPRAYAPVRAQFPNQHRN